MNPWLIMLLISAAVVFGLDRLIRRKKWADNTKAEKVSLLVNMISSGAYLFMSALGMFWGITESGAQTAFGEILYDVTLYMAFYFFLVALVAVVLSFVLRKVGKSKASTWVNIIAMLYFLVALGVNYLAGSVL